jgi:hypothetical protein
MKRLPPWHPKPGQKSKPTTAAYACGECFKVRRKQEDVDDVVIEAVLRRLERPDAAEAFNRGDDVTASEAREALAAIDARLATAADAFAEAAIDGAQLRRITERLRSDRERHEAALRSALPSAIPFDLLGSHAREAWSKASIDVQRTVVDTLFSITILPATPGTRFDPRTIAIEPRRESVRR